MTQTTTNFYPDLSGWKEKLKHDMVGKKISDIRTPSLVIDRARLKKNCLQLGKIPTKLRTKVRIHVKTHKTIEATRIQLEAAKSDAIVVSTLAEAHYMIHSDLVEKGLLKEVLLGIPITPDKFEDVLELSKKLPNFQIFIDNIYTAEALGEYLKLSQRKLSVFIKVDCDYGRAGISLGQDESIHLAKRLQDSPFIHFLGIYGHAGQSYASETAENALEYLQGECRTARAFKEFFAQNGVIVPTISIGATPTVKAILKFINDDRIKEILDGITEVHAGAYAFLDRQQVSTGLGTFSDIAISVACRVSSIYPSRNSILIDGGALAFSKDSAPQGGFGSVFTDLNQEEPTAILTKVSQEHGVITGLDNNSLSKFKIGDIVHIVPNHGCLTNACHLFYLVTEDRNDTVVDVWVPVKGW